MIINDTTNENNYTDYTTLINGSSIENTIMDRKVRYIPFHGYIGSVMEGFVVRTAPVSSDYPNHYIIVDDNGAVRFQNKGDMQISRLYNPSVLPNNLIMSIGLLAWEKLNLHKYGIDLQNQVNQKNKELQEWDEKVSKACEEADERGYCSEFEAIAEAAGIDVPEPEDHEFQVRATILVTVSRRARTEAKAREYFEDNNSELMSEVSSCISGEDEVEDAELI